jgi:D-alanyl-D-alanine carboxypeptidase
MKNVTGFLTTAAAGFVLVASILTAQAGPSILVDANTGAVLEQDDAFDRWYPASLTKLMTAYVAFRAVQQGEVTMQSPVRVSNKATQEPPSKMGYPAGTVLTLDTALKIIMVKSANDIATAIGESLAGSQTAFAARMNSEAKRIGMTGSNFVNAHGLHNDMQYTTAHDLAVLALAIRAEYPQYASYFTIEALGSGADVIENHNTLMGRFTGADGMKTGYTCPAGYNLVASATRNGRTMIAVVIGATSVGTRADRAADMLAKGFSLPPAQGPKLWELTRPADAAMEAVNLRPTICTQAAAKERLAALDEKGRLVFHSAHITGGELPTPRITPISLGGATGPASPYLPEIERPAMIGNIPVPLPRPDYTPEASASAQAPTDGVTQ